MAPLRPSPALQQYIDDELLRAPMVFEHALCGIAEQSRRELAMGNPLQRQVVAEMLQAVQAHRARVTDRYVETLREQVRMELAEPPAPPGPPGPTRTPPVVELALVDEDAVALDIELAQTIQLIRSVAEHELRELRTFVAALFGDFDVTTDHDPFRPEAHARALWAAAQAVPLGRGHQVALMRHAAPPLAQMLRQAYAASCSRLEAMGVEPAAYRTVIHAAGQQRMRAGIETTFSPDLLRMRESLPPEQLTQGAGLGFDDPGGAATPMENWRDIARGADTPTDRQSIELVSHLFREMLADERLAEDVRALLGRLHGPAMRLTLRDPGVLDKSEHPIWRFVHRFAYEAEMAPDTADPERVRLLRLGSSLIDQLAAETEQRASLYRAALQRLQGFLQQRLERRCARLASQIGALQKYEASMAAEATLPSALDGLLDAHGMATVPAELLPSRPMALGEGQSAEQASLDWLTQLPAGQWVRMLVDGRWVRAQLIWPGERREVWLFGDGASDASWAVRRGALLKMHAAGLARNLKMRSLVGSAAARLQERVTTLARA
jgi:hypothetical protein